MSTTTPMTITPVGTSLPARALADPLLFTLTQRDELRAAEAMSHGFGRAEVAGVDRRAANRTVAASFRADLVQRIRRELAEGIYETNDKIDAVVTRLHETLASGVERALTARAAG